MNEIERVIDRINWIYENISVRPFVFCRPVAIEVYVMALETILDALNGSESRADGYRAYLAEKEYGMRLFESNYEVENNVILGFQPTDTYTNDESKKIQEEYQRAFDSHWSDFLNWRNRKR